MKFLEIAFKDRHGEYLDIANDHEVVTLLIDLETKLISGCEGYDGMFAHLNDTGVFTLLDDEGNVISEISDDYIPSFIPNDYHDYLDLEIENGYITNWEPDFDDIKEEFEVKGK